MLHSVDELSECQANAAATFERVLGYNSRHLSLFVVLYISMCLSTPILHPEKHTQKSASLLIESIYDFEWYEICEFGFNKSPLDHL